MAKIKYIWKTAEHRGGLDQCKKTEKEINEQELQKIIGDYDWYTYDNRIDAMRYIRKKHKKNCPDWLHLYIKIIYGNEEV